MTKCKWQTTKRWLLALAPEFDQSTYIYITVVPLVLQKYRLWSWSQQGTVLKVAQLLPKTFPFLCITAKDRPTRISLCDHLLPHSQEPFSDRDPTSASRWRLMNNPPSLDLRLFTQDRAGRLSAASVCHFTQRAKTADSNVTSPLWPLKASAFSVNKIKPHAHQKVRQVFKLRKNDGKCWQ